MFPVCLLVCIWRCSSATEVTCWFPTTFFFPQLGFMESARENISLFLGSDKKKNPFFRPKSHFRIYYHNNTGEAFHWFFIIGFIARLTFPSQMHYLCFAGFIPGVWNVSKSDWSSCVNVAAVGRWVGGWLKTRRALDQLQLCLLFRSSFHPFNSSSARPPPAISHVPCQNNVGQLEWWQSNVLCRSW